MVLGIIVSLSAVNAVSRHAKDKLSAHEKSLKKNGRKNGGRDLPRRKKKNRYSGLAY